MSRRFFTLDVFADSPLAGNPLAVVLDAEGLDTALMQRIAREFNLSETVFVLPPENPHHRARIRIFTPGMEMPFAGHPTVGTALLLATLDHPGATGDFVFGLEENIGVVPCAVSLTGRPYARFNVPRLPTRQGEPKGGALLASALGLNVNDLGFDNHEPVLYGAGFPFCFVPVVDLEAIRRIQPNNGVWGDAVGTDGLDAVFAYTRQSVHTGNAFHARMFSPNDGIPEDPATGSAVAALAGVIAHFDRPANGEHAYRVEQGYEMGRPSLIDLTMTIQHGALAAATIGGHAVIVSEGRLRV